MAIQGFTQSKTPSSLSWEKKYNFFLYILVFFFLRLSVILLLSVTVLSVYRPTAGIPFAGSIAFRSIRYSFQNKNRFVPILSANPFPVPSQDIFPPSGCTMPSGRYLLLLPRHGRSVLTSRTAGAAGPPHP